MGASVKVSVRAFYSILVGLLVLAGSTQAQPFAGGTGEVGSPYQIATAEQLAAIGSDPECARFFSGALLFLYLQ